MTLGYTLHLTHEKKTPMPCKKSLITIVLSAWAWNVGAVDRVSYQHDVKPILDKKCVVCHACYDAPCQLVMTHAQGLERGANPKPVYDGLRASPVAPTRLHIDGKNPAAWREKGFFSVLPKGAKKEANTKTSVLEHLLLLRTAHEFAPNSRLPESIAVGLKRKNVCPQPNELESYSESFPYGGMPLGVTGLTEAELQTLRAWIAQGAKAERPAIQPTADEQQAISRWERFFNRKGLREKLVSRWLYEHLFLAHLYFSDKENPHFFQIVRSTTPPGTPIQIITTRRPNDDPATAFYYRLQPVEDTLVHKTHITFALNDSVLSNINTWFFTDDWSVEKLPGYEDHDRSNPFQTFADIPAEARYRFMLTHAEYFVQTYIRGPVCHGQIATDVIRDQFWVFFQDPKHDLYVTSPSYRSRVTPFMDIAAIEHDLLDGAKAWFSVKKQYDRYSELRQSAYTHPGQKGAGIQSIWNGDGTNTNALLTVFRHHDNASVRKGFIGDYPLTVWWMDYPLLERGYYNLVVNFDVFGSVAHQAQTRLYFDLIRNDAERNFLRLIPTARRRPLMDRWYEGSGQLKMMVSYHQVSDQNPPAITYRNKEPMRELLNILTSDFAHINERPDNLNRNGRETSRKTTDKTRQPTRSHSALQRLAATTAKDLPAIAHFPEVSFIRVFDNQGQREIYSVFRNRMHSNVAFMLGEDLRHTPEEDTLTLSPGILASYPNFMFNISIDEVDQFIETVLKSKKEKDFEKQVIGTWGVRRTHPRFWELFHDLTAYLQEHTPIEAGIMDMSRYENR